MGCNLYEKKFGYMQFLMNKTSEELIDLFTEYKCIAFCTNLLLQSCFRNRTRVRGGGLRSCHVGLCTVTPLFPCFDVFTVDRDGERICRYDFFFFGKADGSIGLKQGQASPSIVVEQKKKKEMAFCTRSGGNVFPIMRLIVWAATGRDARRHDWAALCFFYYFFCF